MNADLVCPATLNTGENLKCSLTLIKCSISNLTVSFGGGEIKYLNLAPSNQICFECVLVYEFV